MSFHSTNIAAIMPKDYNIVNVAMVDRQVVVEMSYTVAAIWPPPPYSDSSQYAPYIFWSQVYCSSIERPESDLNSGLLHILCKQNLSKKII